MRTHTSKDHLIFVYTNNAVVCSNILDIKMSTFLYFNASLEHHTLYSLFVIKCSGNEMRLRTVPHITPKII